MEKPRRLVELKKLGYKDPAAVDAAIVEVRQYFDGLIPKIAIYDHTKVGIDKESGLESASRYVTLIGNIPVIPRGKHIPIQIWLPYTFPSAVPLIQVITTPTMVVNPAGLLNKQGFIEHDYLKQWNRDSNLLDLLQSLIIGFIDVLPVFDLQKFSLPSVVKENITTVMMNFPLLKLDCAEYAEGQNDSRSQELKLDGFIPVVMSGTSVLVPLRIWLLPTFPDTPPLVYVVPRDNIKIKLGRNVYTSGKVRHRDIQRWRHPERNLGELLQHLTLEFSENPPIYAPEDTPVNNNTTTPKQPALEKRTNNYYKPEPEPGPSPEPSTSEPPEVPRRPLSQTAGVPGQSIDMQGVLGFVDSAGLTEATAQCLVDHGFTSLRAILCMQEEDLPNLGLPMAEVCLLRASLTQLKQNRHYENHEDVIESLRSNRAHPSQTDITGSGADLFVRALDRLLGPLMIIKEELDIQEEIGRGEHGVVYKGILSRTGSTVTERVAVKTIGLSSEASSLTDDLLDEILQMRTFNHRNILSLKGLAILNNIPHMLLPFMSNGDLKKYISDKTKDFTIEDLLRLGVHVAHGMKYLSDHTFVHGDLAARNCMVDSEGVVKVGDFGLTRQLYQSEYYRFDVNRTRPVRWMAPESLQHYIYTLKSDVWSYGVLLWELMTRGNRPYPDIPHVSDIPDELQKGTRMLCPDCCPGAVYEIMRACWMEEQDARPTFEAIIGWLDTLMSNTAQTLDHTSTLQSSFGVPGSRLSTDTGVHRSATRQHDNPNNPPNTQSGPPQTHGGQPQSRRPPPFGAQPPPLPPRVRRHPDVPGDYYLKTQ